MGSIGVSVGDGIRGHVVKAPPPRVLFFSHHEMSTGSPGSSQEHSLLPDPCHTKHFLKLSSSWLARMAALTIQASQTLFGHEEGGEGKGESLVPAESIIYQEKQHEISPSVLPAKSYDHMSTLASGQSREVCLLKNKLGILIIKEKRKIGV